MGPEVFLTEKDQMNKLLNIAKQTKELEIQAELLHRNVLTGKGD
jgi:hypothetical protein